MRRRGFTSFFFFLLVEKWVIYENSGKDIDVDNEVKFIRILCLDFDVFLLSNQSVKCVSIRCNYRGSIMTLFDREHDLV